MSGADAGLGAESDAAGQEASVFGRMPVLFGEREYGTWGAHGTCFAYAVATWCFLTGGYAAQLVGAVEGAVCLIAGNLIGVFFATMPLALGCQRYGLEQIDFCKPAFGQRGARIVLVFYLINMIGWSGLILVMFGNGIRNVAEAIGFQPGGWIVSAGVLLALGLSYLICTRGVHLLKLANSIITPGLVVLVAFMFYLLLRSYGWERIAAAPPLDPLPTPFLNYLIALELGIASGFSWWGGIGFLARNTRTRRNSIYPEILQLGFAGGVVCSIALFSALVVESLDPTEWMVPLGGVAMGVLALFFVALANVTSTAVSLFASGLALRHVPGIRGRPWWQVIGITILPCLPFALWPQALYDLGDAFLAYNGTMYAPISGILFADYFLVRRRRLSLWSIFDDARDGAYEYARGFNVPALLCVLLGQVLYLWLYNPMSGETHDLLLRVLSPSLTAFFVPGLVYLVAMRIAGILKPVASDPAGRSASAGRLAAPNL
jgi:NCS1 family nucleobase:cation symporter-1